MILGIICTWGQSTIEFEIDYSNTFLKNTKGDNFKIMESEVMVLEHCKSTQWDLSTDEVSSWYLKYLL